jgi:hypothetical protein
MTPKETHNRIGWQAERDRIDLAAVATGLLGPAPGRTGEHGRRLWWSCPFHEDRNPSFMIDPGKPWWKCWGCGEHGDAASLVMRLEGMTFTEAVARLTGRSAPSGTTRPRPSPRPGPSRSPRPPPRGCPRPPPWPSWWRPKARLWSADGVDALAYLTAPRCLSSETIRAARLGWTPGVRLATKDGRSYSARGWVIPWFDGDRLALVKIRQPDGVRPKYAEAFRDCPSLYPDRRTIRPGRPLVISEGSLTPCFSARNLPTWPPS